MKKIFLIPFLISAAFLAQSPFNYYTGFDNATEQAGWTIFRKADQPSYNWGYSTLAFTGTACANHQYPVGGTSPTDDWFVSPVCNFESGGNIDSLRYIFSGFGTPNSGDTIAIYLLTGSPNPSLAGSKTKLFDFRGTDYVVDVFWRKKTNISVPKKTGPCYIAFRYYTTSNWLDVRFDNLRIRNFTYAGLSENVSDINPVVASYNPASGNVQFTCHACAIDDRLKLELFNITGELLVQRHFKYSTNVETSNLSGIFIYKLTTETDGLVKCGKIFVKSD